MAYIEVRTVNRNCERAGQDMVRQAREANDKRRNSVSNEIGQVAKDIASHIVHKNRDRKFFY